MATKNGLLETAKVSLVKLSDYQKLDDLSVFCSYAKDRCKDQICEVLQELVHNLCRQLKKPFVLCCSLGAKNLAFPTKQGPYIVRCRSPLIDVHHLELVARWLRKSKDVVEEAWTQLPPFGCDLASKVLSMAEDQGIELEVTPKSLMELAEFYSPYEADILATNILENIQTLKKRIVGNVKIDIVIIKKNKIGIGRIISHQFTGEEETEESIQTAVPIVGFILPVEGDDPKEMLELNYFRSASEEVSKSLGSDYEQTARSKALRYPHNHNWYAEIRVTQPQKLKGRYDENVWLECCEKFLEPTLCLATTRAPFDLLDLLAGEGDEAWVRFTELLSKLCEPSLYKTIQLEEQDEKPERMWYQIFNDISSAIGRISSTCLPHIMRVTRIALEKILVALSTFSPVNPFPELEVSEDERVRILCNDLLSGETEYIDIIQDTFIRFVLKSEKYQVSTVRSCLSRDFGDTFQAIIAATEKGDITLTGEPGAGAWKVLIKWYEENEPECDSVCLTVANGLFIPWALKSKQYDADMLKSFLNKDRRRTIGAMFQSTKRGEITLNEEFGNRAWEILFHWYEDNKSLEDNADEELHLIMKDLFEIGIPSIRRQWVDFYSNVIGVFTSLVTLGYFPAFPIIQSVQRTAYRRYFERRLR